MWIYALFSTSIHTKIHIITVILHFYSNTSTNHIDFCGFTWYNSHTKKQEEPYVSKRKT